MKPHFHRSVMVILAALGVSCAFAGSSESGLASPAKTAKSGSPVLQKGMPASDVVRLVGRPLKVEPMQSPEGKAEVWIYRRLVKQNRRIIPVGSQATPTFTGPLTSSGMETGGVSSGSVGVPIYRYETFSTYQVTRLLMFNGVLQASTQRQETTSTFD